MRAAGSDVPYCGGTVNAVLFDLAPVLAGAAINGIQPVPSVAVVGVEVSIIVTRLLR
jgi:hypothetical protein